MNRLKKILSSIKKPYLIVLVVIILSLTGAGYFGFEKYNSTKLERDRELQKQFEAQSGALSETQKQLEALQKASGSRANLASIIQEWQPRIAFLECYFEAIDSIQMGSGILFPNLSDMSGESVGNGSHVVLTNKHVLTYLGYGPDRCRVTFPGQKPIIVENDEVAGTISTYGEMDFGSITLPPLNRTLASLAALQPPKCNSKALYGEKRVPIGEEIIILGYPSIGAHDGITATEGIVSGYEEDYYVTSAKVEHGNSGGAAILLKDSCYLGIPSFALTGSVESLSRILNVDTIFYSR